MSDQKNSNDAITPAPIGEIEHGPSQFEQFLEKNFKKLILLSFLIIVAIAAIVITSQLGDAKAREAGSALLSAQDPDALRAVSKDFPDSAASSSAQILLANQLWDEGQEEEAVKTLESLISSGGEHPVINHAKFALASIQAKKGETDTARTHYEAVLNDSSAKGLHALSLIALGDLAKAEGDDEKARSYYDQKIEQFGDYADQGLAVERLNLVGVDAPTKVGPPAAPPAPDPADLTPQFTPAKVTPALDSPPATEEEDGSAESSEATEEEGEEAENSDGTEDATPTLQEAEATQEEPPNETPTQ